MKFYNRTSELAELQRIQNLSFSDYSRLTVVTGRRRIGKTSLIMKSIEGLSTVYLFVGRKSEATLCSEFIPIISQSLDTFIPAEIRTFRSLFQYLMELASRKPFNLVIDEFQEFYNINEYMGHLSKEIKNESDCIRFYLFIDAENIPEQ